MPESARGLMLDTQVAEILEVHPQTLRRWRAVGKGPPYLQLEGAVRYRPEDVDAYMERCRVQPEGDDG